MVQDWKDSIRVVAQEFDGTDHTDNLLQGASDIINRMSMLHTMLGVVHVFHLPPRIV